MKRQEKEDGHQMGKQSQQYCSIKPNKVQYVRQIFVDFYKKKCQDLLPLQPNFSEKLAGISCLVLSTPH
jgi:hypothetical protein